MFNEHEYLHHHQGNLRLLWLAATSPNTISDAEIQNLSLAELSDELQRELTQGIGDRRSLRFSLRLSYQLIIGLWKLCRRKAAIVRAQAEDCLQVMNRWSQLMTLSPDLPSATRQKRVPSTADVPDEFGEASHPVAAPQELIANVPAGDDVAGAPGLTVHVDAITLREEVTWTRVDPLEEGIIALEGEDEVDILHELDRLKALYNAEQAAGAGLPAASQQAAAEGPALPISPIPRVESKIPALPCTHRHSSRSPRPEVSSVGEPIEASEAGSTKPPAGAEPEQRTAEDVLEEDVPVIAEI